MTLERILNPKIQWLTMLEMFRVQTWDILLLITKNGHVTNISFTSIYDFGDFSIAEIIDKIVS